MPLSAGDRLGAYEILSLLGSGGTGEVWKARDTRLDRIVAIKTSKQEFGERFEREARAVAALNHPHICQIYDVGPNYLVMEYVEGAPLQGPLAVEKAAEYANQILDALDAAHQKGITHRDLKPGNIFVTSQGIKLLDFGLAKQGGPLKETDATLTQAHHRRRRRLSARCNTCRRNSCRARKPTPAAICFHSDACCMKCSPAGGHSMGRTPQP